MQRRPQTNRWFTTAGATLLLAGTMVVCGCGEGLVGGGADEESGMRSTESFYVGQRVEVCQTGGAGLRQRSGPGTGYAIQRVLAEGELATVLAVQGSWYRVDWSGKLGWVYGAYLCATTKVPDGGTGCGELAGSARMRCTKDGNSRGKCVNGTAVVETCARGCLRMAAPADDVCMGTAASWSCSGSYATTKAKNGDYYITTFGCWIDDNGTAHGDAGDNCIPYCLAQAKSTGLCASGSSGKSCEQKTRWYVADSGRFGCLQRLRVTNPANGRQVIVVALDAGPACWVEAKVSKAILDVSPLVAIRLFGGASYAATEKKLVHVVEVDNATPLGPVP